LAIIGHFGLRFDLEVFENCREIKKRMSPLPKLDIPLSVFIKTHWLRLCHLSYQKSENFQGKIFSGENETATS
jgi:hypothetical protein